MQHLINKSKFFIPTQRTGILISSRINSLLQRIMECDVAAISAPSGYGKTTLASLAATNFIRAGYKACWYQIEKQDGELSVFFNSLISAVFSDESIADELMSFVTNQIEIEEKKYNLAAQLCQALWELEQKQCHSGIILCLDDFHIIEHNPDILQVINYILRYAPQTFKLCIISRKETEIQTSVQIKRKVLYLGLEDLLLTKNETIALIESISGRKAEDTLIKTIFKKTSGWVAGVILLCRLIESKNQKAINSMLEKDIPQNDIFRYIAHEILDDADERLRVFMVKIVILSEFTLEEAIAILGMDDARDLLSQCDRQGFLIHRMMETGTVYCFHTLFRDAIASIQEKFIDQTEIRSVALRAAQYYYNVDIYRTVEYYIKCGEIDQALEIVEECGKQYLLINKINYVRRWLGVLDSTIVNRSSVLLFLKALILQHKQPDVAIMLLENANHIASKKKDMMLQLRITIALMHVYSLKGDTGNVTKTFMKFPLSSILKNFKTLRLVFNVISLGKAVYEDNIKSGLSSIVSLDKLQLVLANESNASNIKSGSKLDYDFYWAYLGYSAMIYFRLGDFEKVEATIQKILEMPNIKDGLENYYILQYSINLKYFRKDPVSARRLISELLEKSEVNENDYFAAHCYLYLSKLKHDENDYNKAADYAQMAAKYYLSVGNPALALNATLEKCLYMSDSGKFTPLVVLEQAEEAIQNLSKSKNVDGLDEKCLSIYALLLMESGKYEKAEKALLKSVHTSEAKKARLSLCSTLLFLGRLYYKKQEKSKSLFYIEKALGIAESEGYLVFENMHFQTLVFVALIAYNHDVFVKYIEDLIEEWFGPLALDYFTNNSSNSSWDHYEDFSSHFVTTHIKDNHKIAKSASITIHTLGRFYIVVNGIEIPTAEWKTRKNQALLKYLLMHSGVCIPREKIAGILWPEADKKSSAASLRVALSEIRKTLLKFGISDDAKDPLLEETINGLVFSLNTNVKVDFVELTNYYNLYYSLSAEDQQGEVGTPMLEAAVALYKGEFLPEDQYEDWTAVQREKLKSVFVRLALQLAETYMRNGDYEKAEITLYRIFDTEDYNEEACKKIVNLYEVTNQRGRAMQFLSDFIGRYNREFDILPPEEILDLAEM